MANSRLKDLESDLASAHELTGTLRQRLTAAESAAESTRADFERELQSRLQEEGEKWIARAAVAAPAATATTAAAATAATTTTATATTTATTSTAATTLAPPRPPTASSTTESYFLGFKGYPPHSPQLYTHTHNYRSPGPRSASAEAPMARSQSGFHTPPIRTDSLPTSASRSSLPSAAAAAAAASADMIMMMEDDFDFEPSATPSSPHRHPDLVSVSTVAAGPSVQLVERMSAAVRRLESEMAASREELARVQAQRDEGRREIVELMRQADAKRQADARAAQLEAELAALRPRMETTLELLGEKTERVDELTQDVADLKAMYRQLVLSASGKQVP